MENTTWAVVSAGAAAGVFLALARWLGRRPLSIGIGPRLEHALASAGELLGQSRRDGAASSSPAPSPAGVERIDPRLGNLQSLGPRGFHRIAYTDWGDINNRHIVVCVHGFTRNSRDFDVLAARLAKECRVICMDVVGRGESDWLKHKDDYDYSLYLSDAAALLAHLTASYANETPRIDWIGTSMGGLIGMMLAAKPHSPICRLVLNDVGPMIPWSGLTRLRNIHLQRPPRFKSLADAEKHLRQLYAMFGPIADDHWENVVRHSTRRLDNGEYALTYDPGVMHNVNHARGGIEFGTNFLAGVDLWPTWDRVTCPTLVLRGTESDLLMATTAREMQHRGPKAKVIEFHGIGHAPWLMTEDQITAVRDFLLDVRPASP